MGFERWESSKPKLHTEPPSRQIVLVADEYAPGRARHTVRALTEGYDPECRQTAELLVTEAVTNAVTHADGHAVEVSFWIREGILDVLVIDGGEGFVAQPRVERSQERGGRGLPLIDTLVLSWGSSPDSPGAVWFEIALVRSHCWSQ
jgi:anti-sigma regulatory factor (Ser/Thr protein kinase)